MPILLKRFLSLIVILLTVLLCTFSSAQAEPHQPAKRFRAHLLPAPLYFIDQPSGQIIRLETDGVTRTQVTHTAQRVTAFDLAPADGRLVYVSNNQLIETDAQGKQPRVKVSGQPFSPPDSELAAVYDPKVLVAAPRISPDGRWIAFAWDGVKRVAVGESTVVELIHPNDQPPTNGERYPSFWFYLPESWSPDGRFLLLQGRSPQGDQRWFLKRLADLASPLIEVPVPCCTTAEWMPDSRYLLLGSVGGNPSPLGLGLFDTTYFTIAALLGRFANAAPQFPPSYAITPHETRDGALLAFMNGGPGLPQEPLQKMVRVELATEQPTWQILRSDVPAFSTALWAPDDSGAVIDEYEPMGVTTYPEKLLWLANNGGGAVTLAQNADQPRWGIPPPAPSATGLRAQATHDLQVLPNSEASFEILPLGVLFDGQEEQPLWAVYTTGEHIPIQQDWHQIALYRQTASGWQLIDRIKLERYHALDNIPYTLTAGSIQQVLVEPGQLWLEARVEDQSGQNLYLVRFDGEHLQRIPLPGTFDPSRTYLTDLNQDGMAEVLAYAGQKEIDCPGCGIMEEQYSILRWDGAAFTPVALTHLPPDAPQHLREVNNQAMRLVEADLWGTALLVLEPLNGDSPYQVTVDWNRRLLLLRFQKRSQALQTLYVESYTQLLRDILLGNLAGIQFTLQNNGSPSLATVILPSEELRKPLFTRVKALLDAAIQYQPEKPITNDLHYLHAWATYQLTGDTAALWPDIEYLLQHEPVNLYYLPNYAFLRGDITSYLGAQLTARIPLKVHRTPEVSDMIGQLVAGESVNIIGQTQHNDVTWWQIEHLHNGAGRGWVKDDRSQISTRQLEQGVPMINASTIVIATTSPIVRTLLAAPGKKGRLYALLSTEPALLLPATAAQILVSQDQGKSWSPFAGGLPVKNGCLLNLNLDAEQPDVLYASTCQGLYRWQGRQWERISTLPISSIITGAAQADGYWATAPFGSATGPLLHSVDAGQSWQEVALPHFTGVANLTIDRRAQPTAYAVIWPKYRDSYLRRSIDSGEWETVPTPQGNQPINTGLIIDPTNGALYLVGGEQHNLIWRTLNAAAPDPQEVQWELWYDFGEKTEGVNLLAAGWSPQGLAFYANVGPPEQSVLYRSLNGGKTWDLLPVLP